MTPEVEFKKPSWTLSPSTQMSSDAASDPSDAAVPSVASVLSGASLELESSALVSLGLESLSLSLPQALATKANEATRGTTN
ncbi:MAG: hypothetical protein WBV89_11535 [Ilumatobacter sp.]